MAEAEVRLKSDEARPLPAKPKKMLKLGARPNVDLAVAAALEGE